METPGLHLLSRIFAEQGSGERTVAFNDHSRVNWNQFKSDVWDFSEGLKGQTACRWVLSCDDTYTFSVCLFSLFYADKEILLPPNKQRNTLRNMESYADGIVSDFSVETNLLHLHAQVGSGAEPRGEFVALNPLQAKVNLFTSGSEGEPKRIVKTLSQLEAEVSELDRNWGGLLGAARVFSTVHHQHIYGLLFMVLWPLAAGRAFHRQIIRYPEEFYSPGDKNEKAVLISSPAFLKALPEDMLKQLKSIFTMVFSSGGALDKATAIPISEGAERTLAEVYGSTETGGIAFRYPAVTASWQPFSQIEVSQDEAGRLLIKSPYLDADDWYKTDDLVQIFESRLFDLLGRADSVVKIQEKRVSLLEIEQLLCKLSAVKDCAALVTESLNLKRRQIACVISLSAEGHEELTRVGAQGMNAKFRDYLSDYLDAVVLPKKWRYLDNIEVNSQGKRNQIALKELFKPVFKPEVVKPHIISLTQDADKIFMQLRVPRELGYFEGHFPEVPILPGIVQIDWAIQFAAQHFSVTAPVRRVKGLKFQQVIYPAQLLELELAYEPANKKLAFRYSSENSKHSAGAIIFQ
jgi:3-hydroxymyristoyl/3-hydroxydecanoyl-(acyl carrier protein) dehydratase